MKGTRECTKHSSYPLAQFISYDRLSPFYQAFLTQLNTITIPKTLSKALNSEKWRQAMSVEMEGLEKNITWDIVELLKGKNPMGCQWVFTIKYKVNGLIKRYKARFVAKGYNQTYGEDYLDIFAPLAEIIVILSH